MMYHITYSSLFQEKRDKFHKDFRII